MVSDLWWSKVVHFHCIGEWLIHQFVLYRTRLDTCFCFSCCLANEKWYFAVLSPFANQPKTSVYRYCGYLRIVSFAVVDGQHSRFVGRCGRRPEGVMHSQHQVNTGYDQRWSTETAGVCGQSVATSRGRQLSWRTDALQWTRHLQEGSLSLWCRWAIGLYACARALCWHLPSRYVTSQLGQLSLASLRGRLIEYQLRLG